MLRQPIKHRLRVFGKRSEMAIEADYIAVDALTEVAMAAISVMAPPRAYHCLVKFKEV